MQTSERAVLTVLLLRVKSVSALTSCTTLYLWKKWKKLSRGSSNIHTARLSGGFLPAKAAGSGALPTSFRETLRIVLPPLVSSSSESKFLAIRAGW
jgi:hypothetical protein